MFKKYSLEDVFLLFIWTISPFQWQQSLNHQQLVVGYFRASPRVCQNLLGKSCVLPTFKKLCKVKEEFISNSLA
jgi:hypothetical protein